MISIYVETNFFLELVFQQKECESCEEILALCESHQLKLIMPAYSLIEPKDKLYRQAQKRRKLQEELNQELIQLERSKAHQIRIQDLKDTASLIIASTQEEHSKFLLYRNQLLDVAEIITLSQEILSYAVLCESEYGLSTQDSVVYASVIHHLEEKKPQKACFLNRNSKDFDRPDIVESLQNLNCRMIPRFDHGLQFINSQLSA